MVARSKCSPFIGNMVLTYYVTKLPDNPLGQSALNHLRRYGVKTDHVAWGGDRLGIYFRNRAAMRPSKVVYDRARSSIVRGLPILI